MPRRKDPLERAMTRPWAITGPNVPGGLFTIFPGNHRPDDPRLWPSEQYRLDPRLRRYPYAWTFPGAKEARLREFRRWGLGTNPGGGPPFVSGTGPELDEACAAYGMPGYASYLRSIAWGAGSAMNAAAGNGAGSMNGSGGNRTEQLLEQLSGRLGRLERQLGIQDQGAEGGGQGEQLQNPMNQLQNPMNQLQDPMNQMGLAGPGLQGGVPGIGGGGQGFQ
ncbi:hypothetical protein H2203_002441 [Taxawa tesnikishii (nom. ined.)]|nr:hypothetical protein H2203_002441 [Dothideales sp. JES 119]